MPLELFVALRYLLARRRQAFISLISLISMIGVAVGVMALVIALALMTGLQGELRDRVVAVWGLAFKAQTDDMRESAALVLIDELLTAGATVVAHDPEAMHEAKRRLGDRITYADSNYAALDGADALVIVTDWNAYRTPDFTRVKAALKRPVIIDGRNLYEPAKVRALGFTYASIGRR